MRGLSRIVLSLLALALLAAVLLVAYEAWTGDECETTLCCQGCPSLEVTRVIDGDTLVSGANRIRLYGVDAPEVGQPCWSEAAERLGRMAGGSVRLEAGPRSRDRFGRLLAYVYSEAGESIDERLVRQGFARAWTADGQHRDILVQLEAQAQVSGAGCLW